MSMSAEIESAKHLRDDLIRLADGSAACQADPFCSNAKEVLRRWDGQCKPDSIGALVFDRFRVGSRIRSMCKRLHYGSNEQPEKLPRAISDDIAAGIMLEWQQQMSRTK
jgi:hypothetical protein